MTLPQMSFSGTVLILAILLIRAAMIHRLPKRTFLVLWWLALLRLLLPFSIPWTFSAYSLVRSSQPAPSAIRLIPEASAPTAVLIAGPVEAAKGISVWWSIWGVGAVLCAVFFAMAYIRCRCEFRTALPIENDFTRRWMELHQLQRRITLRQSDRIHTPLTYGIFRPVILLPRTMDWENHVQTDAVLTHEWIHIRRFDAVSKLVLTAALCLHWFNPMVWVMYVLFNRDIELACDECVVWLLGGDARSAYALTLIRMEEKKSGFGPLCSGLSRNATQERIVAIMKTKRTSLLAILAAVGVIAGTAAAFATSASIERDGLSSTVLAEADLKKLSALRFDGYENLSVAEFQERAWTFFDIPENLSFMNRLSGDERFYAAKDKDEAAAFWFYTVEPLTGEHWQAWDFSGMAESPHADGRDRAVLEYVCTLFITDPRRVTVREYEDARKGLPQRIQAFLNSRTDEQLRDAAGMEKNIREEAGRLETLWAKDGLNIQIVWSYMPPDDQSFSAQYQNEWDRVLDPYVPFGLTYRYDSETGDYKMFYQGKEVRGIVDDVEGTWITAHAGNGTYASDAVELFAVYGNGRLSGLREATEAEQTEWMARREAAGAEQETSADSGEEERRQFPHGTEEDYRAVLALMTDGYQNLSLTDFNAALLECVNSLEYESTEGIYEDIRRGEYPVSLSESERAFLAGTYLCSCVENGRMIQSLYTGRPEKDPGSSVDLQMKQENGVWCTFWYQFEYHVTDKDKLTVGERDRRVLGFMADIQAFWEGSSPDELLKLSKADIVSQMREAASRYSEGLLTILVDENQVQFEHMDERERLLD